MASGFGYDYPTIDFSWLPQLPARFQQGQEYGREEALRNAFSGGLPRSPEGTIDWSKAVDIAARTGNIGGLQQMLAANKLTEDESQRLANQQFLSSLFPQQQPTAPAARPPTAPPAAAPAAPGMMPSYSGEPVRPKVPSS